MKNIMQDATQCVQFSKKRVLAVCRSFLLPYIKAAFQSHDWLTVICTSMNEAIDLVDTTSFDFILAEVSFDDGDVWRLSEAIKNRYQDRRAPAVVALVFDEENTLSLKRLAHSQSVYLFNTEIDFDGLNEFLDQVELIQNQIVKHYRLLVIEDNQTVIDSIQHVLWRDFEIDIANDGETGLSLYNTTLYDLVLLDLSLPDMTGLRVLQIIMSTNAQQPVVILTGYPSLDHLKQCLSLGAQIFLAKPIAPDLLLQECLRALNIADLTSLHNRERDTHETHQLLYAANNHLLSGDIHESKALLEKALLLAGHQGTDSFEVDDDAYFT